MLGYLHKLIGIVRQFHEGMRAQVLGDSDASAAFLDSSVDDGGIYINYRTQILTRLLPR